MTTRNSNRSAAVIGAGQVGATLAVGLRDAGFDVTVYSERDRRALRDDVPPTGTALVLGEAQSAEERLGLDTYVDRAPHHRGLNARVVTPDGTEALSFDAAFDGFVGVAVDTRLKADDRLELFEQRGGRFVVEAVTPQRLDEIAGAVDLTLVATGRGGLADLFPVDPTRSPYDRPQRSVVGLVATGLPHGPAVFRHRGPHGGDHSAFSVIGDQGEGWWGPFLHKDAGPAWSFIGWAKPGSDFERRFAEADSAGSTLRIVQQLYRDYADWDAPEIDALRPVEGDPRSWLKGAVRPLVRAGAAVTASGHPVASVGDTSAAYDPIGGQGAQSGLIQAAALVAAAARHEGPFDRAWIEGQYAAHLAARGDAAVRFTRLFLGDPELADIAEPFFAASAVSPRFASAMVSLIDEPSPLLGVDGAARAAEFIGAATGSDPAELLAGFEPDGHFARSEYAAAAAGRA